MSITNIILAAIFIANDVFRVRTSPAIRVRPGLFVISGVRSCGEGTGYCILNVECAMNDNLEPDANGHCDGLQTAFTPKSYFSCCRYVVINVTGEPEESLPPLVFPDDEDKSGMPIFGITGSITLDEFDKDESIPMPGTSYIERNNNFINNETESIVIEDEIIATKDMCDDDVDRNESTNEGDAATTTTTNRTKNKIWENEQRDRSAISEFAIEKGDDINHLDCAHSEQSTGTDYVPGRSLNEGATVEGTETMPVAFQPTQRFAEARLLFSASTEIADDESSATPEESKASQNIFKEKINKKCVNITDADGSGRCVNIWKFVSSTDEVICFGTLINSVWVLTSAACITRIFLNGMNSVAVSDIEGMYGNYGISNMIVHENYKTGDQGDLNNIGLVSLNKLANVTCYSCIINENRKYADKSCSTYTLTTDHENTAESLIKCQDRLKALNMHSKIFFSLPCSTAGQSTAENPIANALWCEDSLVGIETSFDHGYYVFTPVYDFSEWIVQNIQLYL